VTTHAHRKVGAWAAALAALAAGAAAAGDWTQFRGPGGTAVAEEVGLPDRWTAAEGLRWKADLPGRGLSSPAVAGGNVFVTASSGYKEGRLHVLCFDAATGAKRWERQFAPTGNTTCHPKTCMAAPCPVSDGRNVYALFATGDLAALDADGNLLWYRSLVGDYPNVTNQVGMAASPVLYKDTLLLPLENVGDSFAAGIDTKTGKNRWKNERPRDINWVSPLVADLGGAPAAVFQTSKDVTAYDPATGKVRWSLSDLKTGSIQSPAPCGELILVPGEREVYALRTGPGDATPEVVWKSNKLVATYATPVYHKGRVYGLNNANVVSCLDAKTGAPVWQQRVKGPVSASPVIADGKLYVVNEEGVTTVLKLGDKPKVLATNPVGETVLATPSVAGGAIYLRSDGHLFCIGAKKP
jgi:outer membrane protein assembly factor BamB